MWRFAAGVVVGLSVGAAAAAVVPKVDGQGVDFGDHREIACESRVRLGRTGAHDVQTRL